MPMNTVNIILTVLHIVVLHLLRVVRYKFFKNSVCKKIHNQRTCYIPFVVKEQSRCGIMSSWTVASESVFNPQLSKKDQEDAISEPWSRIITSLSHDTSQLFG